MEPARRHPLVLPVPGAGVRGGSLSLVLHRGWEALDEIEPTWRRLLDEQRHPAPCLTPEAYLALRDVASAKLQPLFVILAEDDRPLGILPLQKKTSLGAPTLEWLGRAWLPRPEPLISLDAMRLDPSEIFRVLRHDALRAAIVDLAGLRPAARGTRWLVDGLRPGRVHWTTREGVGESELRLHGGWPRVEASLGLTLRRVAESGVMAGRARGGLSVSTCTPTGAEDLQPLVTLEPVSPVSVRELEVIRRFLRRSLADGSVRLTLVRVAGKTVSASATWLRSRQAVEVLTVADPGLAVFHLREVVLQRVLRHLCEHEEVDAYLLRPGHRLDASLPPIPQPQIVGVLASGLPAVITTAVAWLLQETPEARLPSTPNDVARAQSIDGLSFPPSASEEKTAAREEAVALVES